MTTVVTVGNLKGGVGKTTVATNLACMLAINGDKILLIDSDPQQSSADFHAIRSEIEDLPSINCVSMTKKTIHKDVKGFDNYDIIVIDAGGRDTAVFRSAIIACDHFIIPVTPSQYDVWATESTIQALNDARTIKDIEAYIVLNQVIHGTRVAEEVNTEVDKMCKENEVILLKTKLYSRVIYKTAVSQGLSVVEKEPNGKGAAELKELLEELL